MAKRRRKTRYETRVRQAQRAFEKKDAEMLKKAHKKELIKQHIKQEHTLPTRGEYLGEFVYGAIDGTITTFAVVAGVTGAALSPSIVVILGFANLLADGFSMACSNYLSEKAERELYERERKREMWEVRTIPDAEREEIRQIFKKKGFSGRMLTRAVAIITSNKRVWVDTMMCDELGLMKSHKSPLSTASITFFGFIVIGIIPLLAYVLSYVLPVFRENTFVIAIMMTAVALFIIGAIKSFITEKKLWKSALETLVVGGCAAMIAYWIGFFLRWVVTL